MRRLDRLASAAVFRRSIGRLGGLDMLHRRTFILCGLAAVVLIGGSTIPPTADAATPRRGAVLLEAPRLNWKSTKRAVLYNVQLWRRGRKILSAFPRRSALRLSPSWRYRGHTFRLRPAVYSWYVWPWKGNGYGRRLVRRSFILARVPTMVTPPTVSGEAREGAVLTAAPGRWRGTRPIGITYSWQSCGDDGCVAIPGASGSTLRLGASTVDRRVRVVVRATNIARAKEATSAATGTVLARPPLLRVRPRVLGAPHAPRRLAVLLGRWRSSRPLSFAVEWLRCLPSGCSPIPGASDASYTLTPADVGTRVRASVRAVNSGGATRALSRPTPPIGRVLKGSRLPDTLLGTRGWDVVRGRGGPDTLVGWTGNDRLQGGRGNDRLFGGRGADVLLAHDRVWDVVVCGPGLDTVVADGGDAVSPDCERVRRR